jgi:Dehydrogenases with different specificities (related to short-chain alcohol dehydrogenases)
MLNLNLNAAFYLCREVLRHLDRGGRIVAIGSRAGVQPAAGLSAYGASKAALNALIQTIALEVKDDGITANVVLPSVIDTEANRAGATPEQIAKWVAPESIAGVVYFLCSEAASNINGALIPVYGRA